MAKPGYFGSRWKGPKTRSRAARRTGWQGPPENNGAQPLPVRTGWCPIALWKAGGPALASAKAPLRTEVRLANATPPFPFRSGRQLHEALDILWRDLNPQDPPQRIDAE